MLRALAILLAVSGVARAADWAMGGRDLSRNPVSPEARGPTDWQVAADGRPARNVRWSAPVGRYAIGGPVVVNGLVWVGTNNDPPLDPAVTGDRGVLACFRATDGKFLYQYPAPRLDPERFIADWPGSPLSGSPAAEGDRLWLVTNRREVVCLDTAPLRLGRGPAREVWKYDLVKEQGVFPNSPMIPGPNTTGSPAVYQDLLFVPTGNGVDVDHPGAARVRAPKAPALVCFHKETGKVVWTDASPGAEGLGGNHASPVVIEAGGRALVVHPQTDGWVRAFEAATGKTVWRFDTNRKDARWGWRDEDGPLRHVVAANPVFAAGRLYVAAGREAEFAHGPGRVFCIDPAKRGDVSPELPDGRGKGKPNPGSGLVWDFADSDRGTGLGRTISSVAVAAGLAVLPDRDGRVHCFDARTGRRHWTHDTKGGVFGDPLVVDGKVYVGDDDGRITVLELAAAKKVLAEREMGSPVRASPVYANGTLYVLTDSRLFAIGPDK
jgi:outer membrane protein assembly factor BamB